jgi:ABC-type lipoprotein release transport system permease subunit
MGETSIEPKVYHPAQRTHEIGMTVIALLSAIALVACQIPARGSTRISPLAALRYE